MTPDAAAIAREQLQRLLGQEAGVRAGDDAEAVHRMRVATRRLRTALRLFDLDGPAEELRELAAALGRVRDMDVFAVGLRERATAQELPDVERLLANRADCYDRARKALLALLDGEAFGRVRGWSPVPAPVRSPEKLIAKRLKALRRCRPTTRSERHRTRIRAKRLRYAGEFLGLEPALTALARGVQDALGDAQDADNALDVLLVDLPRFPALARIAASWRADGLDRLERFAELWEDLPSARKVRKRTEARAR